MRILQAPSLFAEAGPVISFQLFSFQEELAVP
jgi:hypothetical protein